MARRICCLIAALLICGLGLTGCGRGGADTEIGGDPASVEAVDGPGALHRIQLSEDAAARIGLKTEAVRALTAAEQGTGAPGLAVPIAAVLYDADGATWVYGETEPRTFQRMSVVVRGVNGDLAVLTSGPAAGTAVATIGAAELRGSEDGVPGE